MIGGPERAKRAVSCQRTARDSTRWDDKTAPARPRATSSSSARQPGTFPPGTGGNAGASEQIAQWTAEQAERDESDDSCRGLVRRERQLRIWQGRARERDRGERHLTRRTGSVPVGSNRAAGVDRDQAR